MTTVAKAKELRPFVERLVTAGKQNTVASRRLIATRLGGAPEAVTKLNEDLRVRFAKRAGGYTRITRLPNRDLDGSPMSIISFV